MFIDAHNLIVEQNGSGGDSAHYSSLYVIATNNKATLSLEKLVNGQGYVIRHPGDGLVEWHSNPGNTSRDQTIPTVVALSVQKRQDLVDKILKQHAKRFFFAQNIDRDWPNTPKKPYPHYYTDLHEVKRFSWFNYRDPLLPHHIHAMVKSAGKKWHWFIYPISLTTFILEGLSLKLGNNDDLGTYFSTAYSLNLIPLFKKLIPNWKKRMELYFLDWRKGQMIFTPLVKLIEEK
jgi:hypothetical protein